MVDDMTAPRSEQRRAPRHPVQQIGMISAKGAEPRYCLIIDRSDDGVRIRTTSDFQAPDQFVLRSRAAEARYKVIWREGSMLGAKLQQSTRAAPNQAPIHC